MDRSVVVIVAWVWMFVAFAAYLAQFAPLAEPLIRRVLGG